MYSGRIALGPHPIRVTCYQAVVIQVNELVVVRKSHILNVDLRVLGHQPSISVTVDLMIVTLSYMYLTVLFLFVICAAFILITLKLAFHYSITI